MIQSDLSVLCALALCLVLAFCRAWHWLFDLDVDLEHRSIHVPWGGLLWPLSPRCCTYGASSDTRWTAASLGFGHEVKAYGDTLTVYCQP